MQINADNELTQKPCNALAARHFLRQKALGKLGHHDYKMNMPQGFNWQRYLDLYPDLRAAGIDCEQSAKLHYLRHGQTEGRQY